MHAFIFEDAFTKQIILRSYRGNVGRYGGQTKNIYFCYKQVSYSAYTVYIYVVYYRSCVVNFKLLTDPSVYL